MKWNKPIEPIAVVPWPYFPGKTSKMDLVFTDNQEKGKTEPTILEFEDDQTGETYRAESLGYFGTYPIDKIPDMLARQATQRKMNGVSLGKALYTNHPDFKNCKNVLFLQINVL